MMSFSDAQSLCQSMEADLASIHDAEEQAFIQGNADNEIKSHWSELLKADLH